MEITESPARVSEADPATVGWRLLALAYDCLPMIPLLMLSSAGFLWLTDGKTVENDPWMSSALFATMWLLAGAYFVFSWRRGGQTVGMRPWRLRVVDEGGQAASVASLCVRYVVACLTPVLGLLWSVVDSQGRALYEIASHTRLVRMRR